MMIYLFAALIICSIIEVNWARYARFQESFVTEIGDFAFDGNVVFLGATSKILKLHFSRREFIAQFEVLSSKCQFGDKNCLDFNQHVIMADGRIFGEQAERVMVSCGSNNNKPRCVIRDQGLLKVIKEVPQLKFVATSSRKITSLAEVHDGRFYYTSYITNNTAHPILGMYSPNKILTSKLDDKWFNRAQFVKLLAIADHMYIFYKELTFDWPSPILTSRVARVCLNDQGGNKLLLHKHFRSFTKASITCISPSKVAGYPDYTYSFIDGVAVPQETLDNPQRQDRMLYAIFSNNPYSACSTSAVCAYDINNMDKSFKSNRFLKIDHGYTSEHSINSVSDSCGEPRSLFDAHKYNMLRDPVQHHGTGPLNQAQCKKYTAIAADKMANMDVLFLATDDNIFIKMAVNNGKAYQVDSFRIRKNDAPINKIIVGANYVLASGPNYLLRIPISQCRRFLSCDTCVASRDPYCGWCPEYRACVATVSCREPLTNYNEQFQTDNLCYPHRKTNNTRRKAKKIRKRRKRRK